MIFVLSRPRSGRESTEIYAFCYIHNKQRGTQKKKAIALAIDFQKNINLEKYIYRNLENSFIAFQESGSPVQKAVPAYVKLNMSRDRSRQWTQRRPSPME